MLFFQKFFNSRVVANYEAVAKKITGMVEQLDIVEDRAQTEFANIEQELRKLEEQTETIHDVLMKTQTLKSNLKKLFE